MTGVLAGAQVPKSKIEAALEAGITKELEEFAVGSGSLLLDDFDFEDDEDLDFALEELLLVLEDDFFLDELELDFTLEELFATFFDEDDFTSLDLEDSLSSVAEP